MIQTYSQSDYQAFLASKRRSVQPSGFEVSVNDLNMSLWDWQALIVRWCLMLGRAAIFADCGLGKTLMQLVWAEMVHRFTGKPVLILCPLAVAWQTRAEALRFAIGCPVEVVESMDDIAPDAAICVANYEKLHLFDCSIFGGVVLDESSILKNYTGKTKQQLIDVFRFTPFKLCCTATPAPNDYLELGNHAEFLGVMPSNEMIARWFINDSMKSGGYRLKGHGEDDFWRWVASWAVCLTNPADLGEQFASDAYRLPDLKIYEIVVDVKTRESGQLFNVGRNVSATNVHQEKRASLIERCEAVANLVRNHEPSKAFAVWCQTDYEANEILKQLGVRGDGRDDLGGVVEIRGSHSVQTKEERLQAFTNGKARVSITKPEIGGFGLNWQHCCNTSWFASFSYEQFYQAVRRFLRFGQLSPMVNVFVVMSENEQSVVQSTRDKEAAHHQMQASMAARMKDFSRANIGTDYTRPSLRRYEPGKSVATPAWLASRN